MASRPWFGPEGLILRAASRAMPEEEETAPRGAERPTIDEARQHVRDGGTCACLKIGGPGPKNIGFPEGSPRSNNTQGWPIWVALGLKGLLFGGVLNRIIGDNFP